GERDVTVYASGLYIAHLDGWEATDISFSTDDRRLRAYEPVSTVFCNGPVEMAALVRGVVHRIGSRSGVRDYLDPLDERAASPPFSLGAIPSAIRAPLLAALEELQVPYFATPLSPSRTAPVVFDAGGCWLIAEDFTLDLP